jgi:ferredoxin
VVQRAIARDASALTSGTRADVVRRQAREARASVPEPEATPPMIVRILRAECCGSGSCMDIAPAVFAIDSKNKAIVLDAEAAERAVLIEAAEACPCTAIIVEDDEGKAVFP